MILNSFEKVVENSKIKISDARAAIIAMAVLKMTEEYSKASIYSSIIELYNFFGVNNATYGYAVNVDKKYLKEYMRGNEFGVKVEKIKPVVNAEEFLFNVIDGIVDSNFFEGSRFEVDKPPRDNKNYKSYLISISNNINSLFVDTYKIK